MCGDKAGRCMVSAMEKSMPEMMIQEILNIQRVLRDPGSGWRKRC